MPDFDSTSFDPEALPYVQPDYFRRAKYRLHDPFGSEGRLVDRLEEKVTAEYVATHKSTIQNILAKTGLRLSGGEYKRWAAIATVPVAVPAESPEQVTATITSIGKAAEGEEAPVITTSWLNFTADERRESSKVARLHRKAEVLQEAILDSSKGLNIAPVIALDHLPHSMTISAIRQRMLLGALGLVNYEAAAKIPYLSVDADTQISANTLSLARESLDMRRALFISGNLQYVGELMDGQPEDIKQYPQELQLLYIVEHMRRLMLNDLPPTKSRGYVPETGFVTKLSTLANIGGFNERAENNESYWLEVAAAKATEKYLASAPGNPRVPVEEAALARYKADKEPFIVGSYGKFLESITRYENYTINTSIEGVEAVVKRVGAAAVVGFDIGEHYTMRTATRAAQDVSVSQSSPSALDVINSAYSYFIDCGGEISFQTFEKIHTLIRDMDILGEDTLPGIFVWAPRYISRKDRVNSRSED